MSNWSNVVKLPPIQFDGDTVEASVRRMEVQDFLDLSGNIKKGDNVDSEVTLSFSALELFNVAPTIFSKYLVALKGLTQSDGTQLTVEDYVKELCRQMYFLNLTGAILTGIMEASTLTSEEEGNSD